MHYSRDAAFCNVDAAWKLCTLQHFIDRAAPTEPLYVCKLALSTESAPLELLWEALRRESKGNANSESGNQGGCLEAEFIYNAISSGGGWEVSYAASRHQARVPLSPIWYINGIWYSKCPI